MTTKKDAILKEYKKRKAAEREAHLIVQKLIENPISKDFFLKSVLRLTKEHYDDVTTERSISRLCGYCLCPNTLTSVLPQRHKIVNNRVYDISDRKKFCSNRCYAVSCKVQEQISPTPLWLREYGKIPDIMISEEIGKEGTEILLRHCVQKMEVDARKGDIDKKDAKNDAKKSPAVLLDLEEKEYEKSRSRLPQAYILGKNDASERQSNGVDIKLEVFNILQDWVSPETVRFILGYKTDESRSNSNGGLLEKEALLHKHLDRLLLGSAATNDKSTEKYVPDYKDLETDVKAYEMKVSNFYGSSIQIKERKCKCTVMKTESHMLHAREAENRIIREKLVMDRAKKIIDGLTPPLPNIGCQLSDLLSTFNLTSKNVVVSIELWPILAISLLYLLCAKDSHLEHATSSEEIENVFRIILEVYNLEPLYLKSRVLDILKSILPT